MAEQSAPPMTRQHGSGAPTSFRCATAPCPRDRALSRTALRPALASSVHWTPSCESGRRSSVSRFFQLVTIAPPRSSCATGRARSPITIDVPDGRNVVLMDGRSWPDQRYAELPRTTPPFHTTWLFSGPSIAPAWLERNGDGLVLRIDLDRDTRSRPLVTKDGRIDIHESFFGGSDSGLDLGSNEVRANLKEWWGRHQQDYVDLHLVTARSNVLQASGESSHTATLVRDEALTVAGALLVGGGAWGMSRGDTAGRSWGAGLIGSGAVALAIGAYLFLAPTHETWLVAPPVAPQ